MLSTLAIVIAGVSFIIVVVTVYRNLPSEPTIVLKSNHGEPTTQVIVVDNELNMVL